jgi:alpha-beta hydrolase superfamily lysophospholipase
MTQHFEYHWNSPDGIVFYGQGWQPDDAADCRAVVCLVHGIGEHSGRYTHVGETFCRAGYALMGFDLRGHGRSTGQRGHLQAMDDCMQDITQFFQQVAQRFPGKPYFLYGHSLGGMLVLNYGLRYKPPVVGVIASAPGLRTALREQKVKVALNALLASTFSGMTVPTGLDANMISRDHEVVRAYQTDPLVHGWATLGMARESFNTIDWVLAHAGEFALPLLLLHGTADSLVYPSGSQEVAQKAPHAVLKLYEGLYHEVHNEPGKETVFADVIAWMDQRLMSMA